MPVCSRGVWFYRNESYKNVLRQEVEFGDTTTGDILSRLGSDTSIVGDSVTNNLSDGLRWVSFSIFLEVLLGCGKEVGDRARNVEAHNLLPSFLVLACSSCRALLSGVVGSEFPLSYPSFYAIAWRWPSLLSPRTVGAMLYISTKLTLVMLAVIPPISLGAVRPSLSLSLVSDPSRLTVSCSALFASQVFYGRYLRKLSKQTQEALGDMTKVRLVLVPLFSRWAAS